MIKKIALVICLCILLCGCKQSDYIEPEERLIITAIGIDDNYGECLVTLETANVMQNTDSDIYAASVLSAVGSNFESAVNKIASESYGKLIFSQCPVVLIGTSSTDEQIRQFLDFCIKEYEVSLSISPVSCDNANLILSENDGKSELLGYELLKLLRFGESSNGITGNDTMPRLINGERNDISYKIPYVKKGEKSIAVSGSALYRNDRYLYSLGVNNSQLISALSGELCGCVININGINLEVKKTVFKDNRLTLYVKNFEEQKDGIEAALITSLKQLENYKYIGYFLPENTELEKIEIQIIGEY